MFLRSLNYFSLDKCWVECSGRCCRCWHPAAPPPASFCFCIINTNLSPAMHRPSVRGYTLLPTRPARVTSDEKLFKILRYFLSIVPDLYGCADQVQTMEPISELSKIQAVNWTEPRDPLSHPTGREERPYFDQNCSPVEAWHSAFSFVGLRAFLVQTSTASCMLAN